MTDNESDRTPAPRGAFTLAEMLAVMAIIAILAGVIVAGSARAARMADFKRARAGLQKLQTALDLYRTEKGRYPASTFNGAMTNAVWQTELVPLDRGLTFPDDMTDPWGRGYMYTNRTRFSYVIMSRGPDTASAHDDLTNEQQSE